MHELVGRLASSVVEVDHELEREFEARLVESSTLPASIGGAAAACANSRASRR